MSDDAYPSETDALLTPVDEGTTVEGSPSSHRRTQSVDFTDIDDRRGAMKVRKTRHRKHMSSISEMITHLEPIGEEFQATGRLMGASFRKRLNSMDRGETGFFDMSVTRSLSVLPDDLEELMEDIGIEKAEEGAQTGPPLFQYIALLSAVAAVSSNSTALHMLDGVSAPMKLYWRMAASSCALAPFAIHSIRRDGLPKLNISGWLALVVSVLAYTIHGCLFVSALEYTTIGNVVIYANTQSLLLIIGKGFVGERIHPLEAFGVVVALSGAIMCSADSEEISEEEDAPTGAIFGDLLALAAAFGGVIYLTFAKAVRAEMSVTLFMFSVMFFGSFMMLVYMALIDGLDLEFSMDPFIGIFGWLDLSMSRLPVLVYLAIVVNIMGTMGFVRAMHYFDNVVIAVATLMEPLMASLIAYAFNAGLLPGPLGWVGNFLVVAGTLGVVYPSVGKVETGRGAH